VNATQKGFYHAWEALLMDFEEVLVGSARFEPDGAGETPPGPLFDRPFSIVKLFHHPGSEMGLELRADGERAVLAMFRQDPERDPGTHAETTELGTVSVPYGDLLDVPDAVMARVLPLLPSS